ncbi:MAG: hypothetical protein IT303_16985 [Dehalococcoidia bacterium]|nr:hypothetical protein [Dehalococcoidia bacterium]
MHTETHVPPQPGDSTAPLYTGHEVEMPAELDRAARWRSYFRHNAITHRHTERPAYI